MSESHPPSDISSESTSSVWCKIKFWIKLIVSVIVLVLIILSSLRQLSAPINGSDDETYQRIFRLIETLDTDHQHFLPLSAEWNQTRH